MEPKHGFRAVERARVDMPKDMSISDLAGYVESWSAYATYRSRHPGVWPVEAMHHNKWVEPNATVGLRCMPDIPAL